MSQPHAHEPTASADSGPLSSGQVRALKIAIVVMGVMIVAGVLTVIGRIFYLASTRAPQASIARPLVGEGVLALPAGAVIRTLSLDGNRVAVHFESPSGAGVAILDAATGKVESRWRLGAEVPQR